MQFTENLFEAHNAKCQNQNVLTHKLVDPVPLNISLIDLDKIHAEIQTNRQSFLEIDMISLFHSQNHSLLSIFV